MQITNLVENNTLFGCKTSHGLSLHIALESENMLFDVSGDFEVLSGNAKKLGIDLKQVDRVIISHGHRDHGGALSQFLEINKKAKIYIQRRAFLDHFSHRPTGVAYIGLDKELMTHPQVEIVDGDYTINSSLELFTVKDNSHLASSANKSLFEGDRADNFEHEQNLVVREGNSVAVFIGCGHNGVVNIMNRAICYSPQMVIGGFHLTNPSAKRDEPKELLDKIIEELKCYKEIQFYTCHCTGLEVFDYLQKGMDNISYFYCGQKLELS
ncbi:MAG: MBL fold metallo-hydrolase [Rikenellaceae bacterium]